MGNAASGGISVELHLAWSVWPRGIGGRCSRHRRRNGGFEGFSLSHNVASENEVDELVAQAVAAGTARVKKPQRVFWGGYSGYYKDPDGHLWEVAHNPLFWVGPSDEGA